jgi:hypothetical protein
MKKKKKRCQQGMVVHVCNPSIWEAEMGGSQIWGHPGIHSETLSQITRVCVCVCVSILQEQVPRNLSKNVQNFFGDSYKILKWFLKDWTKSAMHID